MGERKQVLIAIEQKGR